MLTLEPQRHKWAQKDIDFLLANYSKITYAQIADELHRSIPSVIRKGYALGLKKREAIGAGKSWRPTEIEIIKKKHLELLDTQIGKILNRSASSVKHKRLQLRCFHPRLNRRDIKTSNPESSLSIVLENWLKERQFKYIREYKPVKGLVPRVDFYVEPNIVIEVKGDSNPTLYFQQLLGQLLIDDFCYINSKIYCAIPKNKRMIDRMQMILEHYHLRYGIIVVSNNEVEICRDNYGVFNQ